MKTKKILTFMVAIMVIVSAISFAGCNKIANLPTTSLSLSFSEAYDYSTLSAVGILNSYSNSSEALTTLSSAGEASGSMQEEANSGTMQEEATSGSIQEGANNNIISSEVQQSILDNLTIVKNSVANGMVKSEVVPSQLEGYEYSYTINATNEIGEALTYVFHYNETKREVEDDEEEIHMQGIVILQDIEYLVDGKREIEEGEEEVSFRISLDENNYVVISQEMEEEEQEYQYTVYENGKKVLDTKVQYERDEEDNSIEMVFKTKTATEEVQYKYTFIEDETGSYIGVRIKSNTSSIKALIKVEENELGEINYSFIKVSEDKKGSDKELTEEYENIQDYEEEEDDEEEDK